MVIRDVKPIEADATAMENWTRCALMCLSRSGGWHTCYTKSGPPFGISTLDDTFIILSDARIIRAEQHHQEVQGMAAK